MLKGNLALFFCHLLLFVGVFFSNYLKKKKSGNIIRVSNSLNPDQPRGYKNIYSTQLSRKFILLINVKMPTIVGILTFISMINTTSKRLQARNFFICRYFSFLWKFRAQLSWAWKKFYNLSARSLWGNQRKFPSLVIMSWTNRRTKNSKQNLGIMKT